MLVSLLVIGLLTVPGNFAVERLRVAGEQVTRFKGQLGSSRVSLGNPERNLDGTNSEEESSMKK